MLEYKCEWYGRELRIVKPFEPTSKRCSKCGSINQDLTLSDRNWTCGCGGHYDRDINAAINIRDNYILSAAASQSVEQAVVNQPYVSGACA